MRSNTGDAIAFRDAVRWNWELIREPLTESETVSVDWNGSGTVPTQVHFRFRVLPLVDGLVKDFYVGRLKNGDVSSHLIPLCKRQCDKFGGIKAVFCGSGGVRCHIEHGRRDLLYLDISIRASNNPGRFEEIVSVEFGDPKIPILPIRVIGVVEESIASGSN